ncbi:hypothetical protein H6G51_06235 [Limnothrix sp. FACHB-708]|uniref:hypothetical protein n=1 Tax=unclassified Limnothrix TaxID=2632864 RepID=UPI001684348B|nr:MULTISPECIES: hypothetical protein [unclassified Limnothrix]MBD2552869.1 hypothetical protein [Limnothrix sp. FACHB-708]MBD2589319.1 hypothetical protein [Limnothrix sp. FACHB-406]
MVNSSGPSPGPVPGSSPGDPPVGAGNRSPGWRPLVADDGEPPTGLIGPPDSAGGNAGTIGLSAGASDGASHGRPRDHASSICRCKSSLLGWPATLLAVGKMEPGKGISGMAIA